MSHTDRKRKGASSSFLAILFLVSVALVFLYVLPNGGAERMKKRIKVNSKIQEWNNVDEQYKPELLMDLLNSTLNWMYMTKLSLEQRNEDPDLVDENFENIQELNKVLATKQALGRNSITFREYLASSASDFLKMSQQFYGIKEKEIKNLTDELVCCECICAILAFLLVISLAFNVFH